MQNSEEVEFINQVYRKKYYKITKRHGCFLTQNIFRNMNQTRMSLGRTVKISASTGGTETMVLNKYLYQVPAIFGTNASTNGNHKFYNSTVQAISRGGGNCATDVGALCAHFV